MRDFTLQAALQARNVLETSYLQNIEQVGGAIEEERNAIAQFLEDHPEMEEFLSGDIMNGYKYVPGKSNIQEMIEEMATVAAPNGVGTCDDHVSLSLGEYRLNHQQDCAEGRHQFDCLVGEGGNKVLCMACGEFIYIEPSVLTGEPNGS